MNDLAIEAGDRLRVVFSWRGDRFAHRVEVRDGAEWRVALESIEGTPDDPLPVSPAFQSAHVETRAGGAPTALLLGKSGPAHWSASVAADGADRLVFDVACRLVRPSSCVGSAYRHASREEMLDVQVASREKLPPAVVESSGEYLTIRAQVPESPPCTVRWGYTLACKKCGTP